MTGNANFVLIGVGNEYRQDDALGLCVAREFSRRHPGMARECETTGEGCILQNLWQGAQCVCIVDALSGSMPGRIVRLDVHVDAIPREFSPASSHAFGVAASLEMAKTLHLLPPLAFLYGIVGENFEPGKGLSETVLLSIPPLLRLIEQDLTAAAQLSPPFAVS